jgi:hypothetical protein
MMVEIIRKMETVDRLYERVRGTAFLDELDGTPLADDLIEAADMLRTQAAEIARLRAFVDWCASDADDAKDEVAGEPVYLYWPDVERKMIELGVWTPKGGENEL